MDDKDIQKSLNDDIGKSKSEWEKRAEKSDLKMNKFLVEKENEKQRVAECKALLESQKKEMIESGLNISAFEKLINDGASPEELKKSLEVALMPNKKEVIDRENEDSRLKECNQILATHKEKLISSGVSLMEIEYLIREGASPVELTKIIEAKLFEKEEFTADDENEKLRIENCRKVISQNTSRIKKYRITVLQLEKLIYIEKILPDRFIEVIEEMIESKS